MDFFEQLRKLARQIDREANALRQLSANPRQRQDSDSDSSAVLLLIQKQKDAKKMKREAQDLLRMIQADGSFLNVAEVASSLSEKIAKMLEETVKHLTQYGYQPPTIEKTVEQQKKEPDDDAADEYTLQSTNLSVPTQCHEIPSAIGSENQFDLPPTPTLADFGISQETLRRIQAGYIQPQVNTELLKMPPTGTSQEDAQTCRPKIRHSSNVSETSEGLPEDFCYRGGCSVTPGLLNGASLETPSHRALQRLDLGSPCLPPGPRHPSFASVSSGDSPTVMGNTTVVLGQTYIKPRSQTSLVSDTNTPTPPVFQTPGVKQITRPSIMGMEKQENNSKPSFSLEEGSFGSPAIPVFQTPGVKQITRPSVMVMEKQENDSKPPFSLEDGSIESPAIPLFQTPGVKQIKKLTVEMEETRGTKTARGPIPVLDSGDIPTPEMPQLTSNLKDLYFSSIPMTQPTGVENTEAPSQSLPPSKPHLMKTVLPDFGTPQMPELTGTYSFNTCIPDAILDESDKENDRPKENVDKQSGVQSKDKPLGNTIAKAIASSISVVTEEEFSTQPDYIMRTVPLEFLNSCIKKMNDIFSLPSKDAGPISITEKDMQIHLGPRTRLVFLTLVKLGRIHQEKRGEQTVYCIIPS